MCNYISSEQFWDRVREEFSMPNSPRGKNELTFQEEYGKIDVDFYNTGLGIGYIGVEGNFTQDTVFESLNGRNSGFLCFNSGAPIYMEDSLKKKQVRWDPNVCWNGQQYEGHRASSVYVKDKNIRLQYVIFDNTIFKELIQGHQQFSKAETVYQGDYIDVNFNNYINAQQRMVLDDLLKIGEHDNKLQLLYLESKILDLVYNSFNSITPQKINEGIYLNPKDIESLHRAKKMLLQNMNNPPSLKELAYKSAINEFKLKKGFKQLFGNTVYGFLQEHRLNEAKSLLESNDINIGEACTLVGYKSISHFSKIFKEYFGITPIEIKKEYRKIYI